MKIVQLNFKNVIVLVLPIMVFSCFSSKKEIPKKPHIIVVLVDDLGCSDTGFMGNTVYETPHLDQFASQSTVFTNAYAPAANCAPSRACIMSGLNTPKHGIYTVGSSERGRLENRKLIPTKNTLVLKDELVTIAEALKNNGYATASIGKWHLGENPKTQGFDINIGGSLEGHPKSYFSPYQNKNIEDGPKGEYLTDRLTSEAIHFIKSNNEKPFFLYLPFFTVHTPLQGKKDLVAKYQAKINKHPQFNEHYGAMIENLDTNMGRLLNTLKELNIEENTLVIFLSDNGGLASVSTQYPLRSGKGSYYEGGIRVPCIIKWPHKFKMAKRIDTPISGLDIFPTLMDAINDQTNHHLDGISLLPLILDDNFPTARALFWHFPIYLESSDYKKENARDSLFRTRPGSVIRKGKWKLHEYFEDGDLELYNLETDLGEQDDVSKKYPEKTQELYKELKTWQLETNAPITSVLNPDYKLN